MTSQEKSKKAVALLKEAILEIIESANDGIGNSDIARVLELESDFEGKQKNYLSWSVFGLLVNEGKIRYEKRGARVYYFIK